MPPPMQATTTTRHHHARHHRAQQRQYSAMFGIAVLAAALMTMAAVGPCQALPSNDPTEQPSCLYPLAELTFNPWDAWNILTLGDLQLLSSGCLTQGKVFVGGVFKSNGGQVNTAPSTFATQPPFAVTAGVAWMFESTIINGGVEAQGGYVEIVSSTVHGNVRAVSEEPSWLDAPVVDGVFETKYAPTLDSGNMPNVKLVDSVEKSINMDDVMLYFGELSVTYGAKLQDVANLDLSTVETDGIIRVKLHNRVNIVTDVTAEILQMANKIILSGIPNAVVIFNILNTVSGQTVLISKLDVVYEGARGHAVEPTFNRVLLHFPYDPLGSTANVCLGAEALNWDGAHLHTQGKEQPTANHTEIAARARAIHAAHAKRTHARVANTDAKPVMHFSVFAPGSFFAVDNVIVKGNLIGYRVGLTGDAEVHTQPWGRFAPRGGPVKPLPPRQPAKVNAKCLWGNI